MKLSIVIPVYNEEQTITQIISAVKAVDLPASIDREIVVVNDGSTDGTAGALGRFDGDLVVRIFHQQPNQGKAAAIRRGFQEATGDLLLIQDADLEYHPSQYPLLLAPLMRGEADAVYGSRFKGTIENMAPVNRAANVISNIVFNMLFGTALTDINTCFKLFRAADIRPMRIESQNFTFETEVSAKLVRKGVRIIEVPIHYRARSVAEGKKIDWPTSLEMFWGIVRYRFSKE